MEINKNKLKQIIPGVVLALSLALGITACNTSQGEDQDGYDPNTDVYPALSIDI